MAIKVDYTTSTTDLTVPGCHAVIECITAHLVADGGPYHNVVVAIYKSKAAYNNSKPAIDRVNIRREVSVGDGINSGNFYTWIKTLPEFTGAIDA